jgi:histidine triad (HIT) family protein
VPLLRLWGDKMTDCIFCKIIKGEIPSYKIYEDDKVIAFLDIVPVNKGHTLIIPKKHSLDLTDMEDEDVCALFKTAKKLAPAILKATGADGFNMGMNNRKAAGQLVMHSHLHIMPRFSNDGLKLWEGKKYEEGEADKIKESITKELK